MSPSTTTPRHRSNRSSTSEVEREESIKDQSPQRGPHIKSLQRAIETKMKKLLMILIAGLSLVGIAAAIAAAETSVDKWKPANTQFKIQSKDSVFVAAGNEAHCGQFHLEGTTPLGAGGEFSEVEAQKGVDVTPKVEQCKPSATTVTGPWHLELHSQNAKATCGASEEDPNPEDDCVTIKIPNEGAKINFGICEVKVNANTLTGVYDDDFKTQQNGTGQILGRAVFQNLKVGVTGCLVTTATFNGSFLVNPQIHDD
jgi:hypothetical protein